LLLSWQRLFHSKDVRVAKIAVQVSMPGVNLIKKRFFYSQADQKQLDTLAYSKSASKHNFGYISLDAVHKNKQTILTLVKSELIKSPSLLTYPTHNDFDSADPSSMQDTCHI